MVDVPTFPSFPGITFPMRRTPWLATTRLRAWNGRQFQSPNWLYPLYKIELDISVLRASGAFNEMQSLLGFWNQVMTTPGGLFQFTIPDDNTVTSQLIGVGDGVTTLFQGMRTLGGFTEPVTAVAYQPDTPTSTVDCGLVTASVTSTLDMGTLPGSTSSTTDNGLISLTHYFVNGVSVNATILPGGALLFTVPPANGASITWTGIYNWLCQFDEDTYDLDLFMYQLYELGKITFTTARPST